MTEKIKYTKRVMVCFKCKWSLDNSLLVAVYVDDAPLYVCQECLDNYYELDEDHE